MNGASTTDLRPVTNARTRRTDTRRFAALVAVFAAAGLCAAAALVPTLVEQFNRFINELPSLFERARDALGAVPLGDRLPDTARTRSYREPAVRRCSGGLPVRQLP